MTRDMHKVGACKPGSEESGIPHGHPDEWGSQGPGATERDDNLNAGKGQVGRGVAGKKDARKDAGGGEGY